MIPIPTAQSEAPATAGGQPQQAALADALFCSLFELLAGPPDPEKRTAPWTAAVAAALPEEGEVSGARDTETGSAGSAKEAPAAAGERPPGQAAVVAFLARLRATESGRQGVAAKQVSAVLHAMAAGVPPGKREPSPERFGVEGPGAGRLHMPFEAPAGGVWAPAGASPLAAGAPRGAAAPEAAARPSPPLTIPEAPEATQVARPAVVREVAVRLPENVEVRFAERGGEIRVAVRATDPAVAATLRQGLPELSVGLERAGYHAQIWAPAAASEGETDTSGESRRERREPRERAKRSTGEGKWHPPFRL